MQLNMSALHKLNRAFNSLKKINIKPIHETSRQKFRLTPCLTITELVCKSSEKTDLLPFAITSLIQLLEDSDSNTRLIIDESLNKIIRSSLDNSNHIAKILIALIKILGKSTNERSMKAALWRFAKLSHYIRPQKGKIYLKTLIPIFAKLAARKEESLHETLAESLPNIFLHIGLFTTDDDIRAMLKKFFRNLSSESVEIRRAAAFCIITVCELSRKPEFFFSYTIISLIDFLFDCQYLDEANKSLVHGCLSCVRQVLPFYVKFIRNLHPSDGEAETEKLFEIYELCLFYAKFQDHNVITSALETLNQLLKHSHPYFIARITKKGGLAKSFVFRREKHGSTLSLSTHSDVLSVGSTIAQTEDGFLFGELPPLAKESGIFSNSSTSCLTLNTERKEERTEKWISEQVGNDNDSMSSSSLNIDASHFANSDDESTANDDNDLSISSHALSIENIHSIHENEISSVSGRSKSKFKSMKSLTTMSAISGSVNLNVKYIDLDIGDTIDDCDIPLDYCARFLVSMFLLKEPSESRIRVSVMSLALTCLSHIWKIYPSAALIPLEKSKNTYEDYNNLLDVILSHVAHDDHQIRGYVNIAIANFISSFLTKNKPWEMCEESKNDCLNNLISRLHQGLEDESSICVRHTLHAISVCLNTLMQSAEYKSTLSLLEMIFVLADNPYWLVKMKILEIVQELQYAQLYYVTQGREFQDRIFDKIIIAFLGDSDGRVRSAAAQTLTKFVKNAYYPLDHEFQNVVVTYARKTNLELLPCSIQKNSEEFLHAEQRSLIRMVHRVNTIISSTYCKNVIAGGCEALAFLVSEYPPLTHNFGWQCFNCDTMAGNSYSPLLLSETLLSLLTNSTLIVNFDVHLSILKTVSQLLIALCSVNVKSKKVNAVSADYSPWSFLNDHKLARLAESFLQHLIRLASIFNDIVTNTNVKSLTPVKWLKYPMTPLPIDEPLLLKRQPDVDLFNSKQPKRVSRFWKEEKRSFSQYNHLIAYMQLKTALKAAFTNYEVTLKPESSGKFVTFLKTVLEIFSSILDFTTTCEIDRICKSLLNFLHNFMVFLPVESVRCVKLLLKSVFGTNLVVVYSQFGGFGECDTNNFQDVRPENFYDDLILNPADRMLRVMKANGNFCCKGEISKEKDVSGAEPISSFTPHAKRNINLNILPSYIKLVEPNVIQSLRLYTVTSDAQLQAEVLLLLSELIQLKINYCLLDSEQIFIKFVLSQFQLIEEEHLPNMDTLLSAMFEFLIHLANEKHSKPVMTIPKVIQLCDSLIASIQAAPHCVTAINVVVRHVFLKSSLTANANEINELETQRDVLFAMLLKLLHNPRTFPLLVLILEHCDEETKLKRSNQIVETLLNVLEKQKIINLDAKYISTHLQNLLLSLHPNSYTEVRLWGASLNICYSYKDRHDVASWMPLFTPLLVVLLSRYTENQILDAVKENLTHIVFSDNYDEIGANDSLCISVFHIVEITPTRAFLKIIFQVMKRILRELVDQDLLVNEYTCDLKYKFQLLSEFTLIMWNIVKSDNFKKIKTEFVCAKEDNVNSEEDILSIDGFMKQLWLICPIIVLRWCELVADVDTDSTNDAFDVCRFVGTACNNEEYNLNKDTMKIGLFLLICSRMSKRPLNVDILKVFAEKNFDTLLTCIDESVVHEFLKLVWEKEDSSQVLVEVVEKFTNKNVKQRLKTLEIVRCLKPCHSGTSGRRLMLYCELELFDHPCVLVTTLVVDSVTEIIEYLETLNSEEDLKQHLNVSDLEHAINALNKSRISHLQSCAGWLHRISKRWYDLPVLESEDVERRLNFDHLRHITPDEKWFFNLIKNKCSNSNETRYLELATMLNSLSQESVSEMMADSSFNDKILPYCFQPSWRPHSQELRRHDKNCITSDLYLETKISVHLNIHRILSRLPRDHQVFKPIKRSWTKEEMQYSQNLDMIFLSKKFLTSVRSSMPAVNEYLLSVTNLGRVVEQQLLPTAESSGDLAHFAVLCLELSHWLVETCHNWCKSTVSIALQCCTSILNVDELLNVLYPSHIGSVIFALYAVIEKHTRDVIKFSYNPVFEKIPDDNDSSLRHSVHTVSVLTEYFLTNVPVSPVDDILYRCKMLLITLCRSPRIYDYVRIPLELWKHVPLEDVVTKKCLTLNTISENFLQDFDILQNVVSRIMFYGWNCRLQFEECWMSLLTALNSLPEQDECEEEERALSQVYAVTISAVTSLLVQTLYFPVPGRKTWPRVLHASRNTFQLGQQSWKRKLAIINEKLTMKAKMENENIFSLFDNLTVNIERLHDKNKYNFNQISIEFLLFHGMYSSNPNIILNREDLWNTFKRRQESTENIGIDTNSCVYFLIDFYSRWLLKSDEHSVQVLLEIVNSLCVISDLFTEVTQFSWLLESGIMLWKKYSKIEDSVCAYLVVIICKASSVYVPLDMETKKMVIKILKSALSDNRVTVQTASLQGLLYLLERIFKQDTLNQIEIIDGTFQDEILSAGLNYVLENLDVDLTETYEEKTIYCVISVGYYLIENRACGENTGLILDRFIKLSVRACKMKLSKIHTAITQGMFNLIMAEKMVVKKFDNELSQLVREILFTVECDPAAALLNLQILTASMYSSDDFGDRKEQSSDDIFDSEKLIVKMEKISVFFERIKKCRRAEAKLICSILPQILNDLFPPSEILNKVILEFLSPQQPYPELLAEVVYQVFQNAIQQSQLPLIQDWVLSLLNNFCNCPPWKAVFGLTCFFMSACTNSWLTAFFPGLQISHNVEEEYESRQLLCISAVQFYFELKDESQRKKFITTFQSAEKKQPGGPFKDILESIIASSI